MRLLENSYEDVFAVRVNVIYFIDVGGVIALTAVNYIHSTDWLIHPSV